nr:hypothetical protein [Tanacetum cinerariifolium]
MDAATVLAKGAVEVPTGSGSIPTAGLPADEVPTGSDVVPTASLVFATATVVTPYRRRKGKEVMIETDTLKKQKVQEQIDAQVARELEEKLERKDQRRSEQIDRDADIIRIHAKKRRIELISDLVKYQDNYAKVHKFQSQQRKPWTKKQKRDYYMAVIRSNLGWKVKDFREGQRSYWKITRLEGSSASYQLFVDSLKHLDREDLNQLWRLVKETLSNRPPTSDNVSRIFSEVLVIP